MEWLLLFILISFPIFLLAGVATFVYVDTQRLGMDPRKWTLLTVFVPIIGFFAYLMERSELTRDPDQEPDFYTEGPFEIHESRANDTRPASGNNPDGDDDDQMLTDDGSWSADDESWPEK